MELLRLPLTPLTWFARSTNVSSARRFRLFGLWLFWLLYTSSPKTSISRLTNVTINKRLLNLVILAYLGTIWWFNLWHGVLSQSIGKINLIHVVSDLYFVIQCFENHLMDEHATLVIINVDQIDLYYRSHVTRKPVFGVSDQVWLKPICSAKEAS